MRRVCSTLVGVSLQWDSRQYFIYNLYGIFVSSFVNTQKKGKSQQIKVQCSTLLMKGMEVAEIINFLYIVVNVYCFCSKSPSSKNSLPLFLLINGLHKQIEAPGRMNTYHLRESFPWPNVVNIDPKLFEYFGSFKTLISTTKLTTEMAFKILQLSTVSAVC